MTNGEDYYQTDIILDHIDCERNCGWCNGSGEGQADGTTCYQCKGSGVIKNPRYQTYWVSLIWTKEDLSDVTTEDGQPCACEYCGEDFVIIAKEELKCRMKRGKSL